MDVHTRKLRSFVVAAEELHFSRAAARLVIAQQALSKQISELEDVVGAKLFRRTSRKVELTPAGEAFLIAARTLLAALDKGIESARLAAGGHRGAIRLAFGTGAALELTGPILAEFQERFPDVRLQMREAKSADTTCGLGDGSADVAFLRLPATIPGIDVEPLFVEPLAVAISAGDPLAGRASVSVDDVLALPLLARETNDPIWRSFWTLQAHRQAGAAPRLELCGSVSDELSRVATGVACAVFPMAVPRFTSVPGVAFARIEGIPGSTVAVGWRRDHRTALVDHFVRTVLDVRDRETDIVARIERPGS